MHRLELTDKVLKHFEGLGRSTALASCCTVDTRSNPLEPYILAASIPGCRHLCSANHLSSLFCGLGTEIWIFSSCSLQGIACLVSMEMHELVGES